MSSTRRFFLSLAVLAAVAGAACGDPPDREMQQAQGAIDAPRAAGADQYARDAFTAAEAALKRSPAAARPRSRGRRRRAPAALAAGPTPRAGARNAAETARRFLLEYAESSGLSTSVVQRISERGARMARRDDPGCREYLMEEQRSQP